MATLETFGIIQTALIPKVAPKRLPLKRARMRVAPWLLVFCLTHIRSTQRDVEDKLGHIPEVAYLQMSPVQSLNG